VVPLDGLDAEVDKWAREICKVPLKQLQAQKANVHRQLEMMGLLACYAKWPTDNHDNPEDIAWAREVTEKGLAAALEDHNRSFDDSVLQV
jgi:enoyl-CoA hydratase/carnithine racemase